MAHNFDESRLHAYLDNPNILLDDIDDALDKIPVEDLPLVVLSPDPAFEGGYRNVTGSRPRHLVLEAILDEWHAKLEDFCCVRWHYCDMKKTHGETINLIKALLDGWASVALRFPVPLATVAAYCVQSLFLDHLCDC